MRPGPRSLFCAVLLGGCALGLGSPAAAKNAPELDFREISPSVVAPRLASECTHRRMFLIRNTPEMVVCKFGVRSEDSAQLKTAQLWTFVIHAVGHHRTHVSGQSSLEGATAGGYAVVSMAGHSRHEREAIHAFLHDVMAQNGLRGPYPPVPPTRTE
jgi:hypothetical protein